MNGNYTNAKPVHELEVWMNLMGKIVIALINYGAHALYNYEGSKVGEMTFRKGDQMELVNDSYPCWWVAWNQNAGITGRIHRDFVA